MDQINCCLKHFSYPLDNKYCGYFFLVIVVYHVTIAAIGMKFWHMVIGCVLHPSESFLYLKLYADPLTHLPPLKYLFFF